MSSTFEDQGGNGPGRKIMKGNKINRRRRFRPVSNDYWLEADIANCKIEQLKIHTNRRKGYAYRTLFVFQWTMRRGDRVLQESFGRRANNVDALQRKPGTAAARHGSG